VDIWTGLSIDPVTGVFYASDSSNLYIIDPATGNYTLVGPFGTGLMIDIAMGPNGDMYGHDIGTDSIYWIDPATGAATLIGGPTGYNANYAQGLDFDNEDGTLYIFLYIGSGANVYGIVDLATGGVIPLAVDNPQGEFEGATQTTALPSDVPWLTEVPTNGILAPDLCEVVEVTFDATGVTPGQHLADLIITSNDPLTPQVTLPATLTVGAPAEILDVAYDVDGLTVAFDALVAGDEPLTYAWDLGDGNTSDLEDPVHTYDQAGCYTVTLDVENACGTDTWSAEICLCEPVAGIGFTWMPPEPTVDATVYFSATEPMTGTQPFTYTWDFGDGMNEQGMYVTHVYTAAGDYDVTLMVENACGEDLVTDTVMVVPGCDPVAGIDFAWAPVTPTVDATVYLTASVAFGTPPFAYTWDFGDGSTGEGMAVTHVYTAAGDYEVTLWVENACGEASSADTVTVEAGMHYIYLPIVVKNN
jgi:PKD repeat protein